VADENADNRVTLSKGKTGGYLELPDSNCRVRLTHEVLSEADLSPRENSVRPEIPETKETSKRVSNFQNDHPLERLRLLLIERFDDEELRTLCFGPTVDYDSLQGSGKDSKVRELITYFDRRRDLCTLLRLLKCRRLDVYEDIPEQVKEWVEKNSCRSKAGSSKSREPSRWRREGISRV